MITLQDHIEELRAELRGCLSRRERAAIEAELVAAIAAQKEQEGAAEAHRNLMLTKALDLSARLKAPVKLPLTPDEERAAA